MRKDEYYRVYLGNIADALPSLAEDINACYVTGTFEKIEIDFRNSNHSKRTWELKGERSLKIVITLEEYEGYFLIEIFGHGDRFQKAQETLYALYLKQGGSPDVQEGP